MRKIVLASSSPRRKDLLEHIGLSFDIVSSDFNESSVVEKTPKKTVEKLSLEKAMAIAPKYKDAVIIGADTIVVLKDKILGKPKDKKDAKHTLKMLSGTTHSIITAFTLIDTKTGRTITRSVASRVTMRKISDKQIDNYIKTGEPMDKAGSYAVQGYGSLLIERIEGNYFGIVGLPLNILRNELYKMGIKIL